MSEIEKLRDIVKDIDVLESYRAAREIIHSYHRLHELGCEDLDDFLFEYARVGIHNEYLRYSFENHLISCDYCIERLTTFKCMFEVIDKYGQEAVDIVKAKELVGKATELEKQGSLHEAIKCLKEAFVRRPRDEDIEKRIIKIQTELNKRESTRILRERANLVIDELKSMASKAPLPFIIVPYEEISVMPDFNAVRGGAEPKKITYTIGERIVIRIKAPMDGYLALFQYDDENNLRLLFPHEATDETFVEASKEKNIGIEAKKPLGKHYLKAIWTSTQIIDPKKVNFTEKSEINSTIEKLTNSVQKMKPDEWMVSVKEFEVV